MCIVVQIKKSRQVEEKNGNHFNKVNLKKNNKINCVNSQKNRELETNSRDSVK